MHLIAAVGPGGFTTQKTAPRVRQCLCIYATVRPWLFNCSFRDPRWANIGISTHLSSRCASSSTRTHPSSDAVGTGESKARTNASASSSGQAKGVSDRWSHRRTELRKRWDAEIKKAHEEGKSQEELEEMAAMMKKEEKDLLADRWARTEDVAAFFIASQEQVRNHERAHVEEPFSDRAPQLCQNTDIDRDAPAQRCRAGFGSVAVDGVVGSLQPFPPAPFAACPAQKAPSAWSW